jgi:hypothetical protein
MEKYLLVDCATPITQVAMLKGGRVAMAKALIGNAAESISPLLGNLFRESQCGFEDFDGMIYCGGPGSALGLRVALVSIKTWMIFSQRTFRLLEYNGLDMCLQLNPQFECVCTNGVGENLIIKFRGDERVTITALKNIPGNKSTAFLSTRRTPSIGCQSFPTANYDIAHAQFDILSICRVSTGELENYGSNSYKKWEHKIAVGGK